MNKATEQRIKQKLKDIEKANHIPFNQLLDTLFLERILARISKSKYRDNLIFKGGMCLSHFLSLGRSTKDIDFLLQKINNEKMHIQSVITEIANIDIGDNFQFNGINANELSLAHKKYPGYRISLIGHVGQIRNKVTIDIGVGDIVRPRMIEIELLKSNHPLFENTVELNAYPPEYIFSEKLEAIIHLGEINGRMKDFHDCYRMIDENLLDTKKLKMAITETFSERETKIELIPDNLKEKLQQRWTGFVRKEKLDTPDINQIIETINTFLEKHIKLI